MICSDRDHYTIGREKTARTDGLRLSRAARTSRAASPRSWFAGVALPVSEQYPAHIVDVGQQPMAAAGAKAGDERAAIVVVDHDAGDRQVLSGELSKRYGADYPIVVYAKPEELDSPRTGRATRQPRRHERTHQTRRSPWASW